jgi:hypothetical protein
VPELKKALNGQVTATGMAAAAAVHRQAQLAPHVHGHTVASLPQVLPHPGGFALRLWRADAVDWKRFVKYGAGWDKKWKVLMMLLDDGDGGAALLGCAQL